MTEPAAESRWPLVVFLAGFFAAWTLRATVLYRIDDALDPGVRPLYSLAVKALLMGLPALAYLMARKRPLGPLAPAHWRLPAALSTLYVALVAASVAGRGFKPASEWPLLLASVAVSPIFEELLFRGVIFPELRRSLPFAAADVTSSVLFVLVHCPYWLAHGGLTSDRVQQSAAIFVLSVFLGWLTERTRSLVPAVLMHVANNFVNAIAC